MTIAWLRDHWFLLAALATAATAMADQQSKISVQAEKIAQLEKTKEEIGEQSKKIQDIKEIAVRQDVHIQVINKNMEQQNEMLKILIESIPKANRTAQARNVLN